MSAERRYILGIQPVREAIAAHGGALRRVLVELRAEAAPQLDAVARFAAGRGAKVERVPRAQLDRLAQGERHQGVIAEAEAIRVLDEGALVDQPARGEGPAMLIALDEITDPHNLGAIIRTAVALGADAIVWPEDRAAPLTAATGRASAGAIEHARLARVRSLPRVLAALHEDGMEIIGLDAAATDELQAIELLGPTCLVVGAEGKGLRGATKRVCSRLAKLPMAGPIGSLNASVAAAIALYETVRQRRAAGIEAGAPASAASHEDEDEDENENEAENEDEGEGEDEGGEREG